MAFSGSFLLTMTVSHLLPEVYAYVIEGNNTEIIAEKVDDSMVQRLNDNHHEDHTHDSHDHHNHKACFTEEN